jgi:hypothetical protein
MSPGPQRLHIPSHRLWVYVRFQTELTLSEETHISECQQCLQVVQLCLRSPTFGKVLRELKRPEGEQNVA